MYIDYLVKYRFDADVADFCPDARIEELESDLQDLDGYQDILDYIVEGGEINIDVKFSMQIDFPKAPTGSHPHWCALDCGYCDRVDSWEDALERESEDITEDLETELKDVDGFVSLEMVG
jgi:hypothetical protein